MFKIFPKFRSKANKKHVTWSDIVTVDTPDSFSKACSNLTEPDSSNTKPGSFSTELESSNTEPETLSYLDEYIQSKKALL